MKTPEDANREGYFNFVPYQPSSKPSWQEIDAKADQVADFIVDHLDYKCYSRVVIYGGYKAHLRQGTKESYQDFADQLATIDLSPVGYSEFKEDLRGDGNGLMHFENAIARLVFVKASSRGAGQR